MKTYKTLSTEYYIKMCTEHLAYELKLHKTYFNEGPDNIKAIWGMCQSPWILTKKQ